MADTNIVGTAPLLGSDHTRGGNSEFTVWNINQIHTKNDSKHAKHVANVGDLVWDNYNEIMCEVISVVDNIAEFKTVFGNKRGVMSFLGNSYGTSPGVPRIYYNMKSAPYTLMVDSRFCVFDPDIIYFKLIKDVGTKSEAIINFNQDNLNSKKTDKITTKEIYQGLSPDANAVRRFIVNPTYTSHVLKTGENLTLIGYDNDGHIKKKQILIVEKTDALPELNINKRDVISIALESPYISSASPDIIKIPSNLNKEGLNLIGVVTFHDGTVKKLDLSDSFKVHHLDKINYHEGNKGDVIANYTLSDNETSNTLTHDNKSISRVYGVRVVAPNKIYTLKMFAYPVIVDGAYKLNIYLYNLKRNIEVDISDKVTILNPEGFSPLGKFNLDQKLYISVNLKDLDITPDDFKYVQEVTVNLYGYPTDITTGVLWKINNESASGNDSVKPIVTKLVPVVSSDANTPPNKYVDIKAGYVKYVDWLSKVYNDVDSVYDLITEDGKIIPNEIKMTLISNGVSIDSALLSESTFDKHFFEDALMKHKNKESSILFSFRKRQGDTLLYLGSYVATIKE